MQLRHGATTHTHIHMHTHTNTTTNTHTLVVFPSSAAAAASSVTRQECVCLCVFPIAYRTHTRFHTSTNTLTHSHTLGSSARSSAVSGAIIHSDTEKEDRDVQFSSSSSSFSQYSPPVTGVSTVKLHRNTGISSSVLQNKGPFFLSSRGRSRLC